MELIFLSFEDAKSISLIIFSSGGSLVIIGLVIALIVDIKKKK